MTFTVCLLAGQDEDREWFRLAPGRYDVVITHEGHTLHRTYDVVRPDDEALQSNQVQLDAKRDASDARGPHFTGFMIRGQLKFGATVKDGDSLVSYQFVGTIVSRDQAKGTVVEVIDGKLARSGTWVATRVPDKPGIDL